jgi:alpha-1,2-mannosyltransferase
MQIAASLLAAAITYKCFRSSLEADQKLAVLLAATIFAAPHSMIYDAVMLATAALLVIATTPLSEISPANWLFALGFWAVPLFNPPAPSPVGRVTPLLILGFIITIIARSRATLRSLVVVARD